MKKQPWLKFYPSDWSGDRKLHMCSIGARGLWVEMMCVMHEAEPYGHLITDGKPVTNRQIAALAGIALAECQRYLMELESAGVYSRTEIKTIFSRRMVRDKTKADKDRNNGKGGGNPILTGSVIGGVNPPDKAQIPEARVDRIGSAGASVFTEGSKALASTFWKALGFESALQIPPEFAGVDWRAVEWETAGWTVDLIETEARRIGPDKPLSYHEKVFATTFAKRQAPLPVVEIREAEKLTVKTHGTAKDNSLIGAIDRKLAALEAEASADLALSESPLLRVSG